MLFRSLDPPIPPAPDSPKAPGDDWTSKWRWQPVERLPQSARRRPERTITADPRTPTPSTPPRITPGRRHRMVTAMVSVSRPPASHPEDALERLRNNPSDEEDPPEQTTTTTLTPHILKTTPE